MPLLSRLGQGVYVGISLASLTVLQDLCWSEMERETRVLAVTAGRFESVSVREGTKSRLARSSLEPTRMGVV